MKRIIQILVLCFLVSIGSPTGVIQATVGQSEMRAVWISTVFNLDYPSTKNNKIAQQEEFIQKLNQLQEMGVNTVIVQVRPKADALYESEINPWSDVLTGVQGENPGYDPMAFMIEEVHKRGMAFHAWLNPYRVTTSGTELTALSSNHPARLNPSWTMAYEGKLYYNPEIEGVKQHIVDTVEEIIIKYNVDGIHFDDYFYPSSYPLPVGETREGITAQLRRQAINEMIERVSLTIQSVNHTYNKSTVFGISPPGIWKNSSSDSTGSNTSGNEAYYSIYADSRTWIQKEWIDYIVPQIYWRTGHEKADYETLVRWWSDEVKDTRVKLYIGQGIYNGEVAKEIGEQLKINKKYPQVKGSSFYSLRTLLNNEENCAQQIKDFYQKHPLEEVQKPSEEVQKPSEEVQKENIASIKHVGKMAQVVTKSLNIRSGARLDRPVVGTIKEGAKVKLLDVIGDWYKVKLSNGTVGWAKASYLKVEEKVVQQYPFNATVTAQTLNMRVGARLDREIIGKLSYGTKLVVLSSLNDWYKVRLENQRVGWVSSQYIQKIQTSS